jgi:hypothetical protein
VTVVADRQPAGEAFHFCLFYLDLSVQGIHFIPLQASS